MSGLVRLLKGSDVPIADDAERLGYIIFNIAAYGAGVLSIFIGPIIIVGAVRMMKGKNYGLARWAAVLSLLPISCCFFPLGMIFGIWSLAMLRNAEVKAFFESEYDQYFTRPPTIAAGNGQ